MCCHSACHARLRTQERYGTLFDHSSEVLGKGIDLGENALRDVNGGGLSDRRVK
jgi:hypothetical protein